MAASRLYADLIYKSSTKYPNWDPSKQIRAGDYGKVNRKTGIFEGEGNIYDDNLIHNPGGGDEPQTGTTIDQWHTQSRTAQYFNLSVGPETSMTGPTDVALQAQWKFGRKRAAVLVMYRPTLECIPFARFQNRLVDDSRLHNKDVVTDIYSCPAFGLCLSGKNDDAVAFTLRATLRTSPAGGQLQPEWSSQKLSGIYQAAGNTIDSEVAFIPLFCLKRIPGAGWWARFSRGESDPDSESVNDDQWELPWGDLNEDGEEELETESNGD